MILYVIGERKKSFELKQVKFGYIDVDAPTLSQFEYGILTFIMNTVDKITTGMEQRGQLMLLCECTLSLVLIFVPLALR